MVVLNRGSEKQGATVYRRPTTKSKLDAVALGDQQSQSAAAPRLSLVGSLVLPVINQEPVTPSDGR